MTQEDKDLLIKDLCARLPYGVKVHAKFIDTDTNTEVEKIGVLSMIDTDTVVAFTSDDTNCYIYVTIHEVKPYLFPLSSMTEEQLYELREMFGFEIEFRDGLIEVSTFHHNSLGYLEMDAMFEWFNRNHLDYRGLIPMGLAIDATDKNIY